MVVRVQNVSLRECGVMVLRWGAGYAKKNQSEVSGRQKEDISLELVTVGRGWAPFQLV